MSQSRLALPDNVQSHQREGSNSLPKELKKCIQKAKRGAQKWSSLFFDDFYLRSHAVFL